jgi:hypothetical protein
MKIANGREGGPTLIRKRGMPPKPGTRGYLSKKPGPHSGPDGVTHFDGREWQSGSVEGDPLFLDRKLRYIL